MMQSYKMELHVHDLKYPPNQEVSHILPREREFSVVGMCCESSGVDTGTVQTHAAALLGLSMELRILDL